ncbi:MAG: beta-N-acetylhexosaminidase [Lachnospiraceae bacterium]|nr:beta-N-acetylhexosaminidase [Lachnospiraceae bacterium]
MTEEELFDEMLDTMIAEMPLEDKVAGLFMITPEALTAQGTVTKAGDGTKAALEKYAVGGIIYFKQNITSADQVKEMIDNTNSFSKYPLFIAVDEEGGDVARVQAGLKLDKTPTAKELGEKDNTIDTYDTYNAIGNYLSEYGFNVDFAPVADVLTNENNTAIGNRSFSSDPEVVTRMIPSAVKGLQDAGVSACLKHFPGQGNVDADTHESLAITQKTKAEMTECELKSFAAGIDADVDMIMIGHFSAPELTGDNTPCSISKDVITGILREEMGYDGIIITDAMNMSAISEYYSADEAAIKAIKAGADIVLMPEDFELAYNGVIDAVKDGTIDEQRINDCLKRIYRVKYAGTLNENE